MLKLRSGGMAVLAMSVGCGNFQFEAHSNGMARVIGARNEPRQHGDQNSGLQSPANQGPGAHASSDSMAATAGNQWRALFNLVNASDEPIPKEQLAAYASAAQQLRDTPDGAFHRYFATSMQLINSWRISSDAAPQEIAKLLGGNVATQGKLATKDSAVTVRAEAGHCYTLLTYFVKPSSTAKKTSEDNWHASPSHAIQRFETGLGLHQLGGANGFCASANVAATNKMTLSFPGSKNALAYVVIDHARTQFPLFLSTYLAPRVLDSCNAEEWASLWTDPIPGTVGYFGGKPVLGIEFDSLGNGQHWMTYSDLSAAVGRTVYSETNDHNPSKLHTDIEVSVPTCRTDPTHTTTSDTKSVAECWARLDRAFGPRYDAAERAQRGAQTQGAYNAAIDRSVAIKREHKSALDSQCKPIFDRVQARWEKSVHSLVDLYGEKPYVNSIPRYHELAAIGAAPFTIQYR